MKKMATARFNRYARGIVLALGPCLACFGVSPACAQDYPSRPAPAYTAVEKR